MKFDKRSVTHYRSLMKIEHPQCIQREILPPGLSVTKAAIQLAVSRPTLSNLLNGNAALSPRWRCGWKRHSGPAKRIC